MSGAEYAALARYERNPLLDKALSGTYPNPSVVDDSHSHTTATAPGGTGIGPILIEDTPAGSPLVFADLLQNEEGDDLLYADIV